MVPELHDFVTRHDIEWGFASPGIVLNMNDIGQVCFQDPNHFLKNYWDEKKNPTRDGNGLVWYQVPELGEDSLFCHVQTTRLKITDTSVQELGSMKSSHQVLGNVPGVLQYMSTPVTTVYDLTEDRLVEDILRLASYSPISFQREYLVRNSLEGPERTRRFDFVELSSSPTLIYEVKVGALKGEHILECLGRRGYLSLGMERWGEAHLVFVTPAEPTPDALRLIQHHPFVHSVTVKDLCTRLYTSICEYPDMENDYARRVIYPQFQHLMG
jgi:hypothetical protein